MKKMERYNGETIDAYQVKDLDSIFPQLYTAKRMWFDTWIEQGQTDEGTCTGGKGIQMWYVGPRKRTATLRTVIDAPPVQGNLSAQRSYGPAIDYLKENGIEAFYYDGWMD